MSKWLFECEPHVSPVLAADLCNAHRTLHSPEVRIRERNVYGLQLQGVRELTPVGSDHVGRGGEVCGAPKLGEDLAAGVAVLWAARVFGVREDFVLAAAQSHGFIERPRAVGVQRDPRSGEAFCQRSDCFDFETPFEHTAFELEVGEPIACLRGLREPHDTRGRQGFLIA